MQRTAPRAVMTSSQHVYEVRPRKDKRGVDLISDALPFGGLWYGEPNAVINAIGYAKFRSRSHDAVIRVHDDARNVIETHEHAGEFKVDTTVKRASHAGPDMLQIRRITAFRELERSRLGGRSRCIEGAASERCDGASVKAAYAWQVTIM